MYDTEKLLAHRIETRVRELTEDETFFGTPVIEYNDIFDAAFDVISAYLEDEDDV